MNKFRALRLVTAVRLLVPLMVLVPVSLAAQNGAADFDLRPRASPTPAPPPVVGPADPDNPAPRVRPQPAPRAEPAADAQTVVLPGVTSAPATRNTARAAATVQPRQQPRAAEPQPQPASPLAPTPPQIAPGAAGAAPATAAPLPAPAPFQPRQLDGASDGAPSLMWALLGGLAALFAVGGWLVWSRHFRQRVRALPAPEILRPHVPARPAPAPVAPAPDAPTPVAPPALAPALALVLQATRMSATLVNTTLSYRLSVTNNGPETLRDVIVAGDMIAAHASRPVEQLLGAGGAALPELHRIAGLAPGESVVLGGDIRLPLVSITPIRSGSAALFVPLARLRARGVATGGATIEGGGTFLVGQPGAAAAGAKSGRLQPFRLDLGPRNYSRLGQQLLPAA